MDAPRPVDRHSPVPLWSQVLDDLQRRLANGTPDDPFPTEAELVAEYGVSRHTVRDALRRLRDSGVLESVRGRGTRVSGVPIEQPLGSLYSLFAVVEERGMTQRSDVLALRLERDAVAAERLDLAPDTELLHLSRLRRADDEPLALDRAWLPATLGRPLLAADFGHAALYDELAARTGVRPDGGEERITAIMPDPETRELLEIPPHQACLRVERAGCAGAHCVEYRVTIVRGDRFAVLAQWTPAGYRVTAGAGQS